IPRMSGHFDRLGLIKRRFGHHLSEGADPLNRGLEIGSPVAYIAAQREIDQLLHDWCPVPRILPALARLQRSVTSPMTFVTFELTPRALPSDGMPLQSLLVSRDAHVVGVLRPTLEKLAIEVEVCRGAKSGNEILLSEK